jgi:hypothetical protein
MWGVAPDIDGVEGDGSQFAHGLVKGVRRCCANGAGLRGHQPTGSLQGPSRVSARVHRKNGVAFI